MRHRSSRTSEPPPWRRSEAPIHSVFWTAKEVPDVLAADPRPQPRRARARGARQRARPPTRAVAGARLLLRSGAPFRVAVSRRPRRRVAAVLDAAQRHGLARPRHLLRS